MLQIYGSPLSSPSNKVIYVVNYLNIPYDFHRINLGSGEQRTAEYLKINPYGKVPAIDDDGFTLAESNAIIRFLASKHKSIVYPTELHQRAIVDQWMDYASLHVMMATGRIMFNTYFYQFAKIEKDERSLQDGREFLGKYLPVIEQQLSTNPFIAGTMISLADLSMLAALDTCDMIQVSFKPFPHIDAWRKKLMSEEFYTKYHTSYAETFKKVMEQAANKV